MAMIRVERLSKSYGPVRAVRELSFEVAPGETFALIGPNGAGKTTTLKILLGLVRPDAGTVEVGSPGLAPMDPRARANVGYVPQKSEFPPGRTVAEVLRFFADLRGLGPGDVGRALDRVGLGSHASRRAVELSGGYVQRLALAQALLGDPALLVLDEPTASLDPEATWEFRTLVENLQRDGKTVLLCSHFLAEVERVADRVLILVDGRAAGLERLEDLRRRQAGATRLQVDVDGAPDAARAVLAAAGTRVEVLDRGRLVLDPPGGRHLEALETLRASGVAVRSFELLRPTLEELFLAVVRGGRRDD
ncbi:MAG: ABC transporter ATP-binding protein [Candidatus Eisenbacteria bacterium]|nr:ABC transporter ATP-binding protein [Candidatus Eisenbacteria bacterium]